MPDQPKPAAAVLTVVAPWLDQFAAITCADVAVTTPDGRRVTLMVPLPAPASPSASSSAAPPSASSSAAPPAASSSAAPPAPPPAALVVPLPPQLGERHRAILAAATPEPVKKQALIVRAGLKYDGYSSRLLRELIACGLIVEDGPGDGNRRARKVRLPGPPAAPAPASPASPAR